MPGSRLACAVRRRCPARAAEKGAGGVPAVLLHPVMTPKSSHETERRPERRGRKAAAVTQTPSPDPRPAGGNTSMLKGAGLPCRSSAALPTRST